MSKQIALTLYLYFYIYIYEFTVASHLAIYKVSEQPHHHGTPSYQGTFFGPPHTRHLVYPDPWSSKAENVSW